MVEKLDRKQIMFGKPEDFEKIDREYWSKATTREKFETITYLRECFYGQKATTGRLQRFYKVLKQS